MREKVILVPTDFSENSETAVRYAVGLACDFKARLVFIHAYRLLQTVPSMDKTPLMIREEWALSTNEKFDRLEQEFLTERELDYEFYSEVGFAADAIASTAESLGVDLVIMGSSGEGKWGGVFGSTTLDTITKMDCPVIVVPSSSEYSPPKKITFAYDLKEVKTFGRFKLLFEILQFFKSEIEVLNISKVDGNVSSENIGENSNIEQYLKNIKHHYSIISGTSITDGIIEHINEVSTDMLVVLKRDHNLLQKVFLASITKKIVLRSNLPIMVVRE
jgi:nucleotide-binding universal stress UspA family protein